jgi:DNA-binding transcriptional MerR regulator
LTVRTVTFYGRAVAAADLHDDDDEPGLSVEALADAAGTSVRTVRYYQSEGLLPPPERVGRTARYGPAHAERLALITELQERGLRLQAIRDVLAATPGAPTAEWLGLTDALERPWSEDHPALLGDRELAAKLEGLPASTADELAASGIIERRADTRPPVWFVASPGMLDIAVDSVRAGIPVESGTALRALLQERLQSLAEELVARFADDVAFARLADAGPAALAEMLAHVQPLARRTVDLLFAQEMERAQHRLIEEEFGDG